MASSPSVAIKPGFFNDVRDELKKVTWPPRQETIRLTMVVIIITLIIAAYVGIIDLLLAKLLEVLTKAK